MFYVYEIATSRIMQNKKGKNTWKSYGAARAFLTRLARMGYNRGDYSIMTYFFQVIQCIAVVTFYALGLVGLGMMLYFIATF